MPEAVTVVLRGLEAWGRHGVFPAERELGQRFVVDLELELLDCPGARTDDLAGTVDYGALADAVVELVGGPPQALLERLAARIADRLLAEPLAARATVEVRKPHVALPHALTESAVRLVRRREHVHWLGLGSNLGDRVANLQGLLDHLRDAGVVVEAVSGIVESAPQELSDQPAYLNAVARVRTTLAPPALLDAAKRAERALGRAGGGVRYGPRPADCDLLLWDGGVWDDARLTVPHPRLTGRRFALVPLLQLDADLALPDGASLAAACAAIPPGTQPVEPWPHGRLG
jgi:dihydroneopterin aldolase/2-amino-4-hydroxy-6-hydroxymethyldihydropteridine diphosphokinase